MDEQGKAEKKRGISLKKMLGWYFALVLLIVGGWYLLPYFLDWLSLLGNFRVIFSAFWIIFLIIASNAIMISIWFVITMIEKFLKVDQNQAQQGMDKQNNDKVEHR